LQKGQLIFTDRDFESIKVTYSALF